VVCNAPVSLSLLSVVLVISRNLNDNVRDIFYGLLHFHY
jgi:hypothetical protein